MAQRALIDAAIARAKELRPDIAVLSTQEGGYAPFVNGAGEVILTMRFPAGRVVTTSVDFLESDEGKLEQ